MESSFFVQWSWDFFSELLIPGFVSFNEMSTHRGLIFCRGKCDHWITRKKKGGGGAWGSRGLINIHVKVAYTKNDNSKSHTWFRKTCFSRMTHACSILKSDIESKGGPSIAHVSCSVCVINFISIVKILSCTLVSFESKYGRCHIAHSLPVAFTDLVLEHRRSPCNSKIIYRPIV